MTKTDRLHQASRHFFLTYIDAAFRARALHVSDERGWCTACGPSAVEHPCIVRRLAEDALSCWPIPEPRKPGE